MGLNNFSKKINGISHNGRKLYFSSSINLCGSKVHERLVYSNGGIINISAENEPEIKKKTILMNKRLLINLKKRKLDICTVIIINLAIPFRKF